MSAVNNHHKPEVKDGMHIQHVNAMHMNIRRFLRPYCGVSTKYLENYISLYVWLKNVAAHRKRSTHRKYPSQDCLNLIATLPVKH